MTTVSAHGIGKSALVAMITKFAHDTRPFSKGIITANTADQLRTKTWAEVGKWHNLSCTKHWSIYTATKGNMTLKSIKHPQAWRVDAQTCREENSEAFAGAHAINSTVFYLFDEASAVPNKIHEVSEGGLTDGEPWKLLFGNGTRNSGAFYDSHHGKARHRWNRRNIDSRDVEGTNKEEFKKWIEDHGVDSDFVKVRVRGMFPAQSARQFISLEDVDAARRRHLRPESYNFAPRIIAVEMAWEGDDELVIGMRQGLKFDILATMERNDNDVFVANKVAQLEDEHQADAVFIDAGYGTGVVSVGRTLHRGWQLVWFGGKTIDKEYLNKRAEMWGLSKTWLKDGGVIPDDDVLCQDAIGPETVPRLDGKIQLEAKHHMKERGVPSPNRWDCLAITFAFPVIAKTKGPKREQDSARDRRSYMKTEDTHPITRRQYQPHGEHRRR